MLQIYISYIIHVSIYDTDSHKNLSKIPWLDVAGMELVKLGTSCMASVCGTVMMTLEAGRDKIDTNNSENNMNKKDKAHKTHVCYTKRF